MFKEAVHEIVSDGLRSLTHPVQGYIPSDGIDFANNLCNVRIPNPHGGINPSNQEGQNYIELKAVPLPFFVGILSAWDHLLKHGNRGVLVGFKGANMAFPYIISPLSLVPEQDKQDQTVDDRKNVTKDRALSEAGAGLVAPPSQLSQQILGIQTFEELLSPDFIAAPSTPVDDAVVPFLNAKNDNLANQLSNSILRDVAPQPIIPFQ